MDLSSSAIPKKSRRAGLLEIDGIQAFFASTCLLSPTTTASPSSASPLPQAKSIVYQGFNYDSGASFSSNFSAARRLAGTYGAFASARLYTMIAPDTLNTPTPAIQAALDTNTTLLLGLWASAGGDIFGNELAALRSAIETYKQPFVDLVVGVSVGSEDLYRVSERGKKDMKPGADADTVVGYISRTRDMLTEAGGGLAKGVRVGHADTWGVWRDAPNVEKVIEAVDWVGMNTFPYWQAGDENAPANGRSLFNEAYSATKKAAGKKEVWVTETGFPVTGNRSGQAIPGSEGAE
ncbi:MAG: hypothetical protein Q9167_007163, partial [Letrouitia subvulpina]